MTFVLKDFKELKKYFDDTVTVFLEHHEKKTLAELPSPRKDQLLFLQRILGYIQSKGENSVDTGCYYAAMLVVRQDARNNFSLMRGETEAGSKLCERINECLGITDKNQPELKQYSTWHKELNEVLFNALFISKDSRKGLNKEHPFADLERNVLIRLIKLNYKMEEVVSKDSLLSLPAAGQSKVIALTFKPSHTDSALTQEIVNKFNSFTELTVELRKMISTHLGKRDTGTVNNLSPERAAQIEFLQKIALSLESIEYPDTKNGKIAKEAGAQDFDKTAILAGAMHIVRAQIALSYGLDAIASDDKHSAVYKRLNELLKMHNESPENVYMLVSAANEYIQHLIVETAGNKVQIRETHPLSSTGFDLSKIADVIFAVFKSCHNQILDNAFNTAYPKEQSKSVMSYIPTLSNLWTSSSKKPAVKPTEDEDELSKDAQEPKETEDAAASSNMPR